VAFEYLLDKLESAVIESDPFPHVHIDDFLDDEDFHKVVGSPDITLGAARDVHSLFAALDEASYQPIDFPGCTKSRTEYVAWLESAVKPKGLHAACEGKGMALRCTSPQSEAVQSLDAFFRSPKLTELLSRKFDVTATTALDCGLQKYLNGYEISPHPDIRRKALTWMLNVNPGENTEAEDYHTHYMTFRREWDFVQNFWRDTPQAETCWVPWQWCETQKRQAANNSIVIFAPRYDTLHGIRAHYDHLPAQRTQFYGNLWYKPRSLPFKPQFEDFAGGNTPELAGASRDLKSEAHRVISRFVGWGPKR
jgi:hypothetical protein